MALARVHKLCMCLSRVVAGRFIRESCKSYFVVNDNRTILDALQG